MLTLIINIHSFSKNVKEIFVNNLLRTYILLFPRLILITTAMKPDIKIHIQPARAVRENYSTSKHTAGASPPALPYVTSVLHFNVDKLKK